jgi:hypothetical protein
LGQVDVEESLVVTNIEVSFCTIVGDKDLTVLEGVHCPRVHVQIGIKLLHHHVQTSTRQKVSERSSRKTFAQRGYDSPGDEDVFADAGRGGF